MASFADKTCPQSCLASTASNSSAVRAGDAPVLFAALQTLLQGGADHEDRAVGDRVWSGPRCRLRASVRCGAGGGVRPHARETSQDRQGVRVRHHHRSRPLDRRPVDEPGGHLPAHHIACRHRGTRDAGGQGRADRAAAGHHRRRCPPHHRRPARQRAPGVRRHVLPVRPGQPVPARGGYRPPLRRAAKPWRSRAAPRCCGRATT